MMLKHSFDSYTDQSPWLKQSSDTTTFGNFCLQWCKKGVTKKEDERGQEEGTKHFAAVQDTAHSFEVFKVNSFKEPGEDISK